MMELIVLGEIPGTNFVITFSWVVAMATVLGGMELLRRTHKRQVNPAASNVEDITL